MDLVKAKPPRRTYGKVTDTQAGPGATRVEHRSRRLAAEVRKILDRYFNTLLENEIANLTGVVRKQSLEQRIIDQLATTLARGGVREYTDAARMGDPKWQAPPNFYEQYYAEQVPKVTVMVDSIRDEFQRNVGRSIAQWTTENPAITLRELAIKLRESVYLDGVDVKNPPSSAKLQALPADVGPKITQNIYARSMLIARTEMNQANNAGAYDSIKATGFKYKMWISRRSDGGRGHQELNRKIVPIDEPFIVPEDGTPIMRPGDPAAPAKHVINCRCRVIAAPPSEVRAAIARGELKV